MGFIMPALERGACGAFTKPSHLPPTEQSGKEWQEGTENKTDDLQSGKRNIEIRKEGGQGKAQRLAGMLRPNVPHHFHKNLQ